MIENNIANRPTPAPFAFPASTARSAFPSIGARLADAVTLSAGASIAAPANGSPAQTSDPPQGVLEAAGLGAVAAAYNAGDAMGRVVGGATALTGAVGGAYLGSLGGAATMGAMGIGAGIPASILTGHSGLAILSGAFTGGGALAQVGILLGTACGAVGGYYLMEKVGYAAGFVPTAVVALPVGAGHGVVAHFTGQTVEGPRVDPDREEEVRTRSGLEKATSSVVGGIGFLSGLTGGAVIGGVLSSGAATVGGLIAKDLALSAVLSKGLAGAGIGGAVGAVLLGYGGYKLVQTIGDIAHKTARNIARGKESVELDMKDKELDKRIAGLQQSDKHLDELRAQADTYFTDQLNKLQQTKNDEDKSAARGIEAQAKREKDMDATAAQRNADLDKRQAAVDDKSRNTDTLARQRADARLTDLQQKDEAAYQQRKGSLESWDKQLDAREIDYDRKNQQMDQIVEQQSNARRDQTAAQLDSQYQQRTGALDARETGLKQRQGELDSRKADLPNLVRKEGDRLLAVRDGELKQNLASIESGLQRDLDAHQGQLQSTYQAKVSEYETELRDHESTLQQSYAAEQAETDRVKAEVSSLSSQSASLQGEVQQAQENARNYRDQASSILVGLGSEREALEGETRQARSESSSLRGELSSDRGRLSSAQSQASSARADYERSAQEYNGLQADITSLQNQLGNGV